MEARHIISALTNCGILDADAFIELAEQYDLDLFDLVDELRDTGIERIGINDLIYVALKTINEYFLNYVVHAKRARRFTTVEYQIFTNCMDSSAWFDDDNLERWFQEWNNTQPKCHYLT